MSAECPYGGPVCKKRCALISNAESQADHGHKGGPLPRESWDGPDGLRDRTRRKAKDVGCPDPQAVEDAFEEITQRVYGG